MQYDAFSYPCLDQLINHVGRYRWRTRRGDGVPDHVRMPYGGGVRAPELHDDSPEAYYVHTPGVKVAIPSTPADAKGLLAAAIRDPDPVVVLEPKLHYRTMRGEVPDGEHVVPLGEARVAREGTDVTLVAYGCDGAARRAGRGGACGRGVASRCSTCVRSSRSTRTRCSPRPRRRAASSSSRRRRGRAGYAAELAAILAEKAILDLRGPGPARDGLRRALPVLAARGRLHAVGRARRRRCERSVRRCMLALLHAVAAATRLPLLNAPRDARHGHFPRRDLDAGDLPLTVDSG